MLALRPKRKKGQKPPQSVSMSFDVEQKWAALEFGYKWEEYDNLYGIPQWCMEGELSKADIIVLYRLRKQMAAFEQGLFD